MPEVTLEAVAERLAALERQVAALTASTRPPGAVPAVGDWRCVVGISADNEFTRQVLAEIEANSEAERRAAREGDRP
ncbi:MAG: hypothetical protein K2X87_11660 [Gemmataceae bacterium]|nr:hypothetical protein [Gemmataceae bacterium]